MTSWLSLEKHRLQQTSAAENAAITRALTDDPLTRARWSQIENDNVALRPLPEPTRREWRWWPALVPAFALAGVVVFLSRAAVVDDGAKDHGIKGGDSAVSLVRERDGSIAYDGDSFVAGDRFKIRYTCSASQPLFYDVAVHQGDRTLFPLPAGERVQCANQVLLSGALSLNGELATTVCVRTGEKPPAREAGKTGVCVTLRPAR